MTSDKLQKTAHSECKQLIPSKTVKLQVPADISEDNIELKKFNDGYSVKVMQKTTVKEGDMRSESSFLYQSEEHLGKNVKNVTGHLNTNGIYEIKIEFENNE